MHLFILIFNVCIVRSTSTVTNLLDWIFFHILHPFVLISHVFLYFILLTIFVNCVRSLLDE